MNRFLEYIKYLAAALLLAAAGAGYWLLYRPLPTLDGDLRAPMSGPGRIDRDAQGVPHITAATVEDCYFLQGFATAQDRLFQLDLARRRAAGELAEVFGARAAGADQEMRTLGMRRLATLHAANLNAEERSAFAAYARGVNFFIESNQGRLPAEFVLAGYEPAVWTIRDSVLIGLEMFRSMTNSWKDDLTRYQFQAIAGEARTRYLFPSRSGNEILPGSNAWAISGKHTRSGKPMLASDPHLNLTVPGVWYQVHLKAPGLNAAGVNLPGMPGIGIGHNEHIAWGITNLGFDVQDLYAGATPTGAVRESIRVKGGSPLVLNVGQTSLGPVAGAAGSPLALRWTAAEPGLYAYPFLEINRAANWKQFRTALARLTGPGFNFLYADREGNIGYQAAGRLPIRRGFDGSLPQPATGDGASWDGYIPFEELPSSYNPPSGILVNANQNPFPDNYRYPVNGAFPTSHRQRRITELLAARSGWTAPEFLSVQTDVYSAFSHFFARELVRAGKRKPNPALAEAVAMLEGWDGHMRAERGAPALARLAATHFQRALGMAAANGRPVNYDYRLWPSVVERILNERPQGWFPDYDAALLKSLSDAMAEGTRTLGPNLRGWDYGRINLLKLEHPVLTQVPLAGAYFIRDAAPMDGAPFTVAAFTGSSGVSMRFIADLADWDNSLLVLPLGESGQFLSSHYSDQWETYRSGQAFPMQYGKLSPVHSLTLHP